MSSQRTLLALALGSAVAGIAAAQTPDALRWARSGTGYYGLQAGGADFRLNLQLGPMEPTAMDRILGRTRTQGLSIAVQGNRGWSSDLGIYGRFGSLSARHPASAYGMPGAEGGGLSYGVGLSWDFSPRASAVLGWDSYDFRTLAGERDVRATSLGLQLRY